MNNLSKAPGEAEPEMLSFCAVEAAGRIFGIDSARVHEVLGRRRLHPVPLAPAYIGGMVAYRGEVLTAVSLCALLGCEPERPESFLLVLDGEEPGERLGLMVDRVGGVLTVEAGQLEPNPAMLDDVGHALFSGAFSLPHGLLVKLDPERLKPSRLSATGLFQRRPGPKGDSLCVR